MPPIDNHYTVLGVQRSADVDDIKRAYKQLALKYHPDRGGDGSEEMFKRVACAYEVLADSGSRSKYNQELDKPVAGSKPVFKQNEVRPTGRVKQAFVSECLDGMVRTFDIDPSVFPCSLKHGDHVVVSGDTGVILGITESAVWWWKNGCSLPSRLGAFQQFYTETSASLNCLKWRRTGNIFQNAATKDRVHELERKRLDSLRKFKNKKKEKEKQEAKARKSETAKQKIAAQLEAIIMKEQRKRGAIEVAVFLQINEMMQRAKFEEKVIGYWREAGDVIRGLLTEEKCKKAGLRIDIPSTPPRQNDELLQDAFDDMLYGSARRPSEEEPPPRLSFLSATLNSPLTTSPPNLKFGRASSMRGSSFNRPSTTPPRLSATTKVPPSTFIDEKESKKRPKSAWRPPPPIIEDILTDTDTETLATTTTMSTDDDFLESGEDRSEMSWCGDKLFSEYKAFVKSSRDLRDSWEKGSDLINELGASKLKGLDVNTMPSFEKEFRTSAGEGKAAVQTKGLPSHSAKRAARKDALRNPSTSPKGKKLAKSKTVPVLTRARYGNRHSGLRPCSPGTFSAQPEFAH
eukprot:TRINITY_DN24634_c0_g1_i1.p1 TRINITY_DN24634_c0_g1~~TRINITY_DN24634_c0_g1_i1.p1  ORF type:complete len:573 (+),score=120.17 TRINITY_DN24634_c0_g1_i1:81-1799(+)